MITVLLLNYARLIGASRTPIEKGKKTAVAKEANSVPIKFGMKYFRSTNSSQEMQNCPCFLVYRWFQQNSDLVKSGRLALH